MTIKELKVQIADMDDSLEVVRAFSDEPAYGLRPAAIHIITVLTTNRPNVWAHDMGPSTQDGDRRITVASV